jgi:hypothetical protein
MNQPIRIQDIRTLFRAREIASQLKAQDLDSAIEAARAKLIATKGRRQYLQEILPDPVVYAVPCHGTETFDVECADERRFRLQDATIPVLWQIRELEILNDVQAVKIVYRNGCGQREYWL